jgi:hypothetical protein
MSRLAGSFRVGQAKSVNCGRSIYGRGNREATSINVSLQQSTLCQAKLRGRVATQSAQGRAGKRIWIGWAVLAYNLDTLAIQIA